jgi:hypothetical protein
VQEAGVGGGLLIDVVELERDLRTQRGQGVVHLLREAREVREARGDQPDLVLERAHLLVLDRQELVDRVRGIDVAGLEVLVEQRAVLDLPGRQRALGHGRGLRPLARPRLRRRSPDGRQQRHRHSRARGQQPRLDVVSHGAILAHREWRCKPICGASCVHWTD